MSMLQVRIYFITIYLRKIKPTNSVNQIRIFKYIAKVPDDKLAVMVFIHGGSYAEYSGNDQYFGPDFLIEKQVILVTLNYRLGEY